MQFRKYSKEDFILAVQDSTSIRQALIKLDVKPYGGNYITAKSYIKELNLDTSHFLGKGWNKGRKFGPKRPIEDYLSNKHKINSFKLKCRLLDEQILDHKCDCCKNTKWLDCIIPLELHHKDGNSKNNNLTNLQLLCPNCHAMTDNYRGKNKKSTGGGI